MEPSKKSNFFHITIDTEQSQGQGLKMEQEATLKNENSGRTLKGKITTPSEKKEAPSSQMSRILPYFAKQFKAIFIPLRDRHGRRKFLSIGTICATMYTTVIIGSFFVRGWRLGVIHNVARRLPVLAPNVQTLTDIGKFITDGILLIFMKFLYDVPKILLLVFFGYEFIELFLNFFSWAVEYNVGTENRGYWSYLKQEDIPEISTMLFWKAILFLAYSFLVTPTYKIMTIKYAFCRNWRIFFDWAEIKDSFKIYRNRPRSTLAAYLWDQFVSGIGILMTLIFLVIPILGLFAAAFARFIFSHWPKAHGYGVLARHLIETEALDTNRYSHTQIPMI